MKTEELEQQLFESSMVSSYIYMCGFEDAKRNRPRNENIYLANQQNKFDQLFGDLFGDTGGRFFLIEFKRERDDFEKEITGYKPKPMRVALYNSLWADPDQTIGRVSNSTWALGRACHFGAYRENDRLKFEAYGRAVHPSKYLDETNSFWTSEDLALTPTAKEYFKTSGRKVPPFVYYPPLTFDKFYAETNLTIDRSKRANSQGSISADQLVNENDYPYFHNGLGLPPKAFDDYLSRMLACMDDAEREKVSGSTKYKKALVGWFSYKLGAMAFIETPLTDLLVHYDEAKSLTAKTQLTVKPTKTDKPRPK